MNESIDKDFYISERPTKYLSSRCVFTKPQVIEKVLFAQKIFLDKKPFPLCSNKPSNLEFEGKARTSAVNFGSNKFEDEKKVF